MKKVFISTDLFKDKSIPPFLKEHHLFRNPVKVDKVFPSIGLPNFREKANIDKCFVDIKKEGTYVHNLLRIMVDILNRARDTSIAAADKIQYLEDAKSRERNKTKLTELYSIANTINAIIPCVDPYNQQVLDEAIHTSDGKIALKLIKDIADKNAKQPVFRKNKSLFSVFSSLREKCTELGVEFTHLDNTDAFKIFSKENIPNKEFAIVFSSVGPEGAYDIATMSMRGIKSCQRWDGEYPRCLIGSILSKFVGVIYLTSGVQADNQGQYTNLGTKMMRRCVVRYAIDADENKPCVLIDKMYPELDKDVLSIFVNALQSKTQLPVYYAQDLGNRLRHIYSPNEKIRNEISNREWSYQDTPLRSKDDLNVFLLNSNKDEVERETRGFKLNFSMFLARDMEDIFVGNKSATDEIKKTINNIKMNTPLTTFCDKVAECILGAFRSPPITGFPNSRSYYRKYLMEMLSKRKQTMATSQMNILAHITENTSRTVNTNAFISYIFSVLSEFTKQEITGLISV